MCFHFSLRMWMINILIRISNIHLSSVPPFLWAFCPKLQPPYLCARNIIIPMAVTGTGMLYSCHPSKVSCRYSDAFPKCVNWFSGPGSIFRSSEKLKIVGGRKLLWTKFDDKKKIGQKCCGVKNVGGQLFWGYQDGT